MVYVITLTIVVDRASYEPHLPDHLAYLRTLIDQGLLLLSGPFADRSGGMLVVRAESQAQAEAIAQADPLVARGLDRYEVRAWQITDGLLKGASHERLD